MAVYQSTYVNMTDAEYRARPGVNKSTLWEIRRSPAHYRKAVEGQTDPDKRKPEPAPLRIGTAAHMTILQPGLFAKSYAILGPDVDRRTKAGKEAIAALETTGKEILTAAEGEQVMAIRDAVAASPSASALLDGCICEAPLFWTDPETGIECKCRVDALRLEKGRVVALDLKTSCDAGTESFAGDAIRRGYDVQAAHYIRGIKAEIGDVPVDWYFIAVEKEAPYAVNVLRADAGFLDNGEWRLMELMQRLQRCREADNWPDYGENDLILPAWAEYRGDWISGEV